LPPFRRSAGLAARSAASPQSRIAPAKPALEHSLESLRRCSSIIGNDERKGVRAMAKGTGMRKEKKKPKQKKK
jgi:hypothetical protein